MNNKIYPCLWFDTQAEEAACFYTSVFNGRSVQVESPIAVTFEIGEQKILCINGGPQFKPNPTMSFYVICEMEDEIDQAWQKLTEKGTVMMPLDKYEWSEKYGWVQDHYGISWQVTRGKLYDLGQKITPALMYVGDQFGRGEEALHFYASVFKDSAIHKILRYEETDELQKGKIKHSQFSLLNHKFILMDSGLLHDFAFTEALSLVIECDTQHEIDYYWKELTKGGEESMCGWLKDKFGFSWQIVPAILSELMSEPERAQRVTAAFLKMKKLNIEQLIKA